MMNIIINISNNNIIFINIYNINNNNNSHNKNDNNKNMIVKLMLIQLLWLVDVFVKVWCNNNIFDLDLYLLNIHMKF